MLKFVKLLFHTLCDLPDTVLVRVDVGQAVPYVAGAHNELVGVAYLAGDCGAQRGQVALLLQDQVVGCVEWTEKADEHILQITHKDAVREYV